MGLNKSIISLVATKVSENVRTDSRKTYPFSLCNVYLHAKVLTISVESYYSLNVVNRLWEVMKPLYD